MVTLWCSTLRKRSSCDTGFKHRKGYMVKVKFMFSMISMDVLAKTMYSIKVQFKEALSS